MIRRWAVGRIFHITLAAVAIPLGAPVWAQYLTQTVQLQPGWNAVWLEVDPPDRTPAVVFAGIPTSGVWTWSERISATDFIQNPGSSGWNRAQWLSFFAPGTPEERLSNLYAILPRRAYLIKLAGSNAVNWSVTGKPSLKNDPWSPDRFNLRGFPVDPGRPPSFLSFFRSSPAHYDPDAAKLQPIYRLQPSGKWEPVQASDSMRRGEAYWVYTKGASSYVAPFSLSSSSGEDLNYGAELARARLLVTSGSQAQSIQFSPVNLQTPPLLLVHSLAELQTNRFSPFTNFVQSIAPQQTVELTLALDRTRPFGNGNPDGTTGGIYSASDGQGTLQYFSFVAKAGRALAADPVPNVGLWIGDVTITNVAQTRSGTSNALGAVPRGFPMRLLIHVDTNGNASLLREVALIYARTNITAPSNYSATVYSAKGASLFSDPARVKAVLNNPPNPGQVIGRRISSSNFDFPTGPGQYDLPLSGVFAMSNQLSGKIVLSSELPTNPFLHRYHPDHGTNQAFTISREFQLTFAPPESVPGGNASATIGGSYAETIRGLHKFPLMTSGTLLLQQISKVGVLNQLNVP